MSYYDQKKEPATIEGLQGEIKALRDEIQWLRSQLAMRAVVANTPISVPVSSPPTSPFNPPLYYSGGNY